MFVKFILNGKEVTYQELQERMKSLEVTDSTEEYIELYEVKADGTLVFETNCTSFIGG